MSGAIRGARDEFHIFEQGMLCGRKPRFVKPAFDNCLHTLIAGSLYTQEVSMAVRSIRTTVQERDITGDHFFVPAGEMSFRKMDGIRKIDHLAQEVRPCAEALDDARNRVSPSCR